MNVFRTYEQKQFTTLLAGRELVPMREVNDQRRLGCFARIDLHKTGTVQIIFAGLDKNTNKFVIQQMC